MELTCRFKKLSTNHRMLNKKQRYNNRIFLGTKLNWLIKPKKNADSQVQASESTVLQPTPLLAPRTQKYFVSIFQSDYKANNELVIESKLIIKKTDALANSGQYFCSTHNFNANNMLNGFNTSKVDIRVVNKNYMNTGSDKVAKNADVLGNKSTLYCPQFIAHTHKGVYTWPRTLASVESKQSCSLGSSVTSNAYLVCEKTGMNT